MSVTGTLYLLTFPSNYPQIYVNDAFDRAFSCMHIVANVVGYIPIVGTIVGIARVALFGSSLIEDRKSSDWFGRTFCLGEITRGLVEVTSCGFLLLIPDFLVSTGQLIYNRLCTEQ